METFTSNTKNPKSSIEQTISREQYIKDIESLALAIKRHAKKQYGSLYGIPRGGYFPAIELSRLLNIPVVTFVQPDTLIVDDICDTGNTLEKYSDNDTAVVYVRLNSVDIPTFYASIKEGWLHFPDEKNEGIEENITRILSYINEDPNREGLIDTPARIARMYKEIFRGYNESQKPKITTFTNDMQSTDIVFDSGDYYSMCEHHMLPFFGKYYFAYIPKKDGKILGISKVARVVGYCAARLQLQERLARDVVNMLTEALDGYVEGMAIVMKGTHLCKTMRGVRNNGTMTVSHLSGIFKDDSDARAEFYKLIDQQ